MKIVGIDYGEKRVGLAVTDVEGLMAFPRAVLPNDRALIGAVSDFIKKEKAGRVVVGESKARDGSDNPVMRGARQFAETLARETGVAVDFEPEFYTSAEARRLKEQAGTPSRLVDAEAAGIILSSYLERQKNHDGTL